MKENCYKYYKLWIIVCGLLISSCAQIVTPTGGERDKIAPKITKSTPENKSLNFQQNTIKIKFDEWIQPLTNPKNQIIISPNVEPFPKIEVLKNEVSIKFKENTLQPNTTYSIFFGDNLKDNNEGNPFPNYKYLFSTGNYLDSISIKGKVSSADGKIPENSYLLLYKEKEDSAFLSKKPFYISKINSDGSINLENVKEGNYKIYALSDKNGNYYYDLPNEEIGFDTIFHAINGNIDTLDFQLFKPEDDKFRIAEFDRTIKNGILNLTLNKEISFNKDEITVVVADKINIEPVAFQEKDAKKLKIYFPNLKDSTSQTLLIRNNKILIDSIQVKIDTKKANKIIPFFNDTIAIKNITAIETQAITLIASYYCIQPTDTSRISVLDSSNNKIQFEIFRAEDLQTYFIKANWKAGIRYKLILKDSTFTDLAENYSKNQEFSFLATSIKKAGKLLITYELPQKNTNYIVLFKDAQGKVLNKHFLSDSKPLKIDYGLLLAGNYSVEIIEDLNDDGILNSGNFYKKTLPEKTYKHEKTILIKENWDAEEIITINFTNYNKKDINNKLPYNTSEQESTIKSKLNIDK